MPVKPAIYLDTSVINYLYATDTPELMRATTDFFENYIKAGVYQTYVSNVVIQEINNTTNDTKRKQLLNVVNDYLLDFADLSRTDEIEDLADLYIKNRIIPPGKRADALHIAISVVNQFDYLVSWNYKHLSNVNRSRKVLAVNYQNNYLHPLGIITPFELMDAQNT